MPSSDGELTVQLETRTFLQQSISNPSRLVSTFKLSIVRLSTPVASIANHPPCKIEMSFIITLRQSNRLMALLGRTSPFLPLLTNPFPHIFPVPIIETSCRFSPQIKLLCQWLCP